MTKRPKLIRALAAVVLGTLASILAQVLNWGVGGYYAAATVAIFVMVALMSFLMDPPRRRRPH